MKKIMVYITFSLLFFIMIFIYYFEGVENLSASEEFKEINQIKEQDAKHIMGNRSTSNYTLLELNPTIISTIKGDTKYYVSDLNNLTIDYNPSYELSYYVDESKEEFTILIYNDKTYQKYNLVVTGMPILNIKTVKKGTKKNGVDYSTISIEAFDGNNVKQTAYAEYCIRGGTSRRYDKKSYSLKSLDDNNLKIFGFENNELILNSLFEDESKMRDIFAWDIWNSMKHQNKKDNHINLDMIYVELFIDDEFQGLYGLQEYFNVHASDFSTQLDSIYKVITWVLPEGKNPRKKLWGGVELDYSGSENDKWIQFENFYDILNIQEKSEFNSKMLAVIDLENIIDYYLFTELIMARDNLWKNIFVSFNKNRMIISPWDLDISFGSRWTGHEPYYVSVSNEGLYDPLYAAQDRYLIDKLIYYDTDSFQKKAAECYFIYREYAFNEELLMETYQKYSNSLAVSRAKERDYDRWPTSAYTKNENIIEVFIKTRLSYLDSYFKSIIEGE